MKSGLLSNAARRGLHALMVAAPAIIIALAASSAHSQQPQAPAPLPQQRGTAAGDQSPGYLGIVADDRTVAGRGVRIVQVHADSPAERGGLRTGDLVTGMDGHPVRSMADLARVLEASPAGTDLSFQLQRDGQAVAVTVRLGTRPPREQRPFENFGLIPGAAAGEGMRPVGQPRTLLGIRTVPVTDEARRFLGLPSSIQGAVVTEVLAGSPAARAGIPLDAVIVSVDRQPVDGPDALSRLITQAGAGTQVELNYYFRGQLEGRTVTLEEFVPPGPPPVPDDVAAGAPGMTPLPGDELEALRQRIAELERRIAGLEAMIERLTGEQ